MAAHGVPLCQNAPHNLWMLLDFLAHQKEGGFHLRFA